MLKLIVERSRREREKRMLAQERSAAEKVDQKNKAESRGVSQPDDSFPAGSLDSSSTRVEASPPIPEQPVQNSPSARHHSPQSKNLSSYSETPTNTSSQPATTSEPSAEAFSSQENFDPSASFGGAGNISDNGSNLLSHPTLGSQQGGGGTESIPPAEAGASDQPTFQDHSANSIATASSQESQPSTSSQPFGFLPTQAPSSAGQFSFDGLEQSDMMGFPMGGSPMFAAKNSHIPPPMMHLPPLAGEPGHPLNMLPPMPPHGKHAAYFGMPGFPPPGMHPGFIPGIPPGFPPGPVALGSPRQGPQKSNAHTATKSPKLDSIGNISGKARPGDGDYTVAGGSVASSGKVRVSPPSAKETQNTLQNESPPSPPIKKRSTPAPSGMLASAKTNPNMELENLRKQLNDLRLKRDEFYRREVEHRKREQKILEQLARGQQQLEQALIDRGLLRDKERGRERVRERERSRRSWGPEYDYYGDEYEDLDGRSFPTYISSHGYRPAHPPSRRRSQSLHRHYFDPRADDFYDPMDTTYTSIDDAEYLRYYYPPRHWPPRAYRYPPDYYDWEYSGSEEGYEREIDNRRRSASHQVGGKKSSKKWKERDAEQGLSEEKRHQRRKSLY
ncbi:uncharacterized protein VTP21DRAFT_5851 [Calcarisporiella thermophila]|uniref:uncharacterized protein n=1 Tax=Calcarisporiella thermophila TaxID=911321 RepID=UPI00374298E7